MSNKKSIEASTEGERNTERALKQALEEKYGKSIEASTEGERNTERALKQALKETEIQRELERKHTEKKEHGARGKLLLGCSICIHIQPFLYTRVPSSRFLYFLQQLHAMIVQLPYATAIPINILDIYVIRGEMYFHVLCRDNIVQILHYRILKSLAPNLYRSYFRKRSYSF